MCDIVWGLNIINIDIPIWLVMVTRFSISVLPHFEQFRNDRKPTSSGKACGGGILVYVDIDNKWSTNNNVIYNHTDNHCEILTIKSRPHWFPREFSSIISVSCYTPFTGNSRLKHNATATGKVRTWRPHSLILKFCSYQLAPIITRLFRFPIDS